MIHDLAAVRFQLAIPLPRRILLPDGREMIEIRGGATGVSMTNYLEDALLDEVLRGVNFAAPATVYMGLFTAAPGETGGGTEVSGNGYARQSAAFTAGPGVRSNTADIIFPVATPGAYGTVTSAAVLDASSAGNMLLYGTLNSSITINAGDQFVFRAGQITVTFD